MAKKKGKPQVINNIQELNLEIDYDKLAEAIVKAQEKATEQPGPSDNMGFWKSVWSIIRNKESRTGMRGAGLLSEVISFIFNVMAIICIAISGIIGIMVIPQLDWHGGILQSIFQGLFSVLLLFISLGVALIFRAVANEIKAEKDRDYILSVFSGILSFAALIVALAALFKGVG